MNRNHLLEIFLSPFVSTMSGAAMSGGEMRGRANTAFTSQCLCAIGERVLATCSPGPAPS